MLVVGTAGHIDHGKSALVEALTGTDPDRLPEEKARGITIDLGFAHATFGGVTFSFVDVPGHERFVRTMVAGATGIDLALLAVASDDSVMPQTREHLSILKLLGVSTGVVARTKSDLVDAETGALVEDEIRRLVAGSFLERAPIVAVSATTGAGLEALRAALVAAAGAVSPRATAARFPRLFVDRAFTMKGFGPVVTGTLDGGTIRVDDRLVLLPAGKEVRVRRVEVHGEERNEARAGERTSLNLAGVERAALTRGQALAPAGALVPSTRLTVELTLLPDAATPLRDGADLRLHLGTADVGARLSLLADGVETDSKGAPRVLAPGKKALAQLLTRDPVPALRGDRFVVRRPSPAETLGGGRVLDTSRPRISRKALREPETRAALATLRSGSEADVAALLRRETAPARPAPPPAKPTPLGPGEGSFAERIAARYRHSGFTPPRSFDVGKEIGTKAAVVDGLVSHLIRLGELVRLSPDLVVHRDTVASAVEKLDSVRGRTLSVGDFRDLFGLTRKSLIPLLEHLDQKKKTRRTGDQRVVL